MTIYMWIATTAWLFMVVGFINRKTKKVHIACMLTTITLDLGLVLFLQITRSAVQTAMGFDLPILQYFHIGFSTLAVVLYFPILYTGMRLNLKGFDPIIYKYHKLLGYSTLTTRTLGFCFMFSMWK